MLDLFGRQYVIDHCLSEVRNKNELDAYRYYLTDALRYTVNNTAEQEKRYEIKKSYRDIHKPKKPESKKAIANAEEQAKQIIENFKHSKIFEGS